MGAFLEEEDEPYRWLVPGLFEFGDRCVITAVEGLGKSEILAQFALTVAAGSHPFTGDPLAEDGYRVLILDAENPRNKLRRRLRRIRTQVDELRDRQDRAPVDWHKAARLVLRPEGVDLASPAELTRIERDVEITDPDLMVIGPFYKLSELDTSEELGARKVCALLDRLRVRHDFTLIAETHCGHGDGRGPRKIRPIGSSLFLRWPEFGLGFVPHESAEHMLHPNRVNLTHWRIPREQRHWPTLLEHGRRLPWEPANLDYWDRPMEP
jgi:replicative DNA helicase